MKAYAKLMNEMWNMPSNSVAPQLFKRILGEYAPTFQGFGQHDSHECISSILDLMGEDLYRKGKKPYVEIDEKADQPEAEAALEAWNKHLLRNESIITDLFHGQFKSTVDCSQCSRVSITFDPYMTLMVPIPTPKKSAEIFYIPYKIGDGYINHTLNIKYDENDSMRVVRENVKDKYGFSPGDFAIGNVSNNRFSRLFNTGHTMDDVANNNGAIFFYELDPSLNPKLPSNNQLDDGMYGISEENTMIQVHIGKWEKERWSGKHERKLLNLPRLLWVKKSWTMKQLHRYTFAYMRQIFQKWAEATAPDSEDQIRNLIDFPFLNASGKPMTPEEFKSLSDDQAFDLCFKDVISAN